MKLIASNQMTLTNLLEKAETRRETFYKLTNEGALGNLVVESKLSKGWLNANGNGQILGPDAKGERTTDFIQVVAGNTYTFQWWATVSEGQKAWEAWQFYDSNQKPFGSRGGYGEYGSDGEQHGKRTITAPANACYIRLSYRSFGNGHIMFEAGAGSASFEPSFDDSLKQGGRNLLVQTNRGATNWEWAMGNGDKHVEDCLSDGVNAVKLVKGTETECTSWSFFNYKGLLRNLIRPSAKYTLSFEINPSADVTLNASLMRGNAQGLMTDYPNMPKALANQWASLKTVLTARDTLPEISDQVVYLRNFSTANGNYAIIKNIKLEESEDKTPWTPAPEDLGWSMTTLVPTQSQRYLWKFEYIYYSDGSVEVTSPINISIAGEDGKNSYMHTAYANITKLCNENQNFTIKTRSIVRYGYGDKWVYKTFEAGTYIGNSTTFGKDPYQGKVKQCDLVSDFSLTDSTGRNWLGTYSDNSVNAVSNPSYFTWQLTKGQTGATGPQGIQGLQGPKGDQGIQGPKGADGKTQYTHIAYADNATGGGFSQTDQTKAYIGMYVDFNATDSTDPTKYRWSKWHGDKGATGAQGIQGPKGDDGRTPYLHIAYANSADGRTDFSTSNSGNKRYLGTYTDYTQADSTDPSKYKWVDMVGSVEVGGVNLLHNSKGPFQPKGSKIDNCVTYSNAWISMEKGKEYTLSAKGTAPFTGSHATDKEKNEICLWLVKHDENINVDRIISSSSTGNGGTKFTWNDPSGKYYLRVNTYKIDNSNYAEDVQIEEGNVKTTYTRNPEDVQADIDSKADQALTQQQLNALAEKNRNMEAEMAAKASLAEVEQWKQAYDAYVAQNDADKTSAEQKLITLTSRVAEWVKDWEDKKVQWSFLDTNMDFGEEGLRLGKKGSPTSILISNDRIGFYSGGSEVASMSNGTLTIDNGIFAKSLQIGHYREEVYEGDKTINVIRWID